jgi:multiple sugar transport system substrate-binding protein
LGENWLPTNWEEILDGAEAIRDNTEAVPFGFNVARSAGEAVTMQTFLMLLEGTDDALFDHESGKWIAESQGFLDSLRFIDDVFNNLSLAPSMSLAMGTNYASVMFQDLLPNGNAGIALDGFWNVAHFVEGGAAELENPESTLAFLPFPTQFGQGAGSVTMSGGLGWAIPANSRHHDLAWRVVQELGSEVHQATRATLDGNLTVREDSAQDARYTAVPFMAVATSFLENAHFRPAREEYPQISVEIQAAVEAVATGSRTPEQAMEEFTNSVIRIAGEENIIRRDAQ